MDCDDVVDLIEEIWLPLDPDRRAEWWRALQPLDAELASQVIVTFREAAGQRPSISLFNAAYRARAKRTPDLSWFEEQRAKLRPQPDSQPRS